MTNNDFINTLMVTLHNKLSEADLSTVIWEISAVIRDWEIKRRSTALALYEGLPLPYKAFMVTKKMEGRSEGTLYQYQLVLEDLFAIVRKPLVDISTNDLRYYLIKVQEERNISPRTLDGRRLILSSFFTWCNAEGYIDHNPCASISPIKYEETPREPISDIDLELLRDACRNYREKAMVEVLYSTGCRCAELANLQIEDIDFDNRKVHLFGKGKKHRFSFLSARAAVYLMKYMQTRSDDSTYVFVTDNQYHHKLTTSGIEQIIHNIGERIDMDDIYPHKFRHTFATNALNKGMPVAELQQLLGHASLDTTMIYAKVNPFALASSHDKVIN